MKNILLTFTIFLVQTALLAQLNIEKTLKPSILYTQKDSSLTASPSEQIRFSLTFNSMLYHYEESMRKDTIIAFQKRIIDTYAEKTKVQASNTDELSKVLDQNYELSQDCFRQLSGCSKDLEKYMARSKRRGKTIVIAVPIGFALGVGTGIYLTTL